MSEPTFTEAIAKIKKELAGLGILLAAVGGGGSWFGIDEVQKSEASAVAIASHYVPALASCEARFEAQRKVCLDLVAAERENTAQWRAQCSGGP